MTANVFPYPDDLPPGSQNFAREVIRRITDLELASGSSSSEQDITNKGLSAYIETLSARVRDLVGRVSYQIGGTDTLSWTSSAVGPIPFGPILKFTLTERRVVSVAFNARMSATAQMSSPGTATSSMSMSVLLDGQSLINSTAGTAGYIVAQAVNAGSTTYNNVTQSARYLVTLDPGEHTVQGVVPGVSRINGIGSLDISNPAVFVDVLQAA